MKRIILSIIIILSAINNSYAENFWQPQFFKSQVNGISATGDTILLVTAGSGVTRSFDGGITWESANEGMNIGGLIDIVRVGNRFIVSTDWEGLYMSMDYGSNWTQMKNNMRNHSPKSLEYFDGKVFMTTNSSGIFFSTDQGDNWIQSYNVGINYVITFITKIGSQYFAAENNGNSYTSTTGFYWYSTGLHDFYITSMLKKDAIFIAGTTNGIWLSYDSLKTWKNTNLEAEVVTSLLSKDNYSIAGTNKGIYKSTDNGSNWKKVSKNLVNYSCTKLVQNGNELCAASGDGLYISKDEGETWIPCHIYDPAPQNVKTILNEDSVIYSATDHQVFKSVDNGHKWKDISSGLNNASINRIVRSGTSLIAATWSGIFKTTDDGMSWMPANKDLTNTWVTNISEYNGTLLATTTSGLFKSNNSADNWEKTAYLLNNIYIDGIYNNGKVIFVVSHYGEILYSIDNGSQWKRMNQIFPGCSAIFQEQDTLYFGSEGGLYSTYDLGKTWKNLGLHDYLINCVFKKGIFIFAGTNHGFFYTNNNGLTWTKDNTGLLNNDVGEIFINGNELLVGTHGAGIYRHVCKNLPAPKLTLPLENETGKYSNVIFIWDSIPYATSYKIQIALDKEFKNIQFEDEVCKNRFSIFPFKTGTQYYWRVQAFCFHVPSSWSEIRSFNTIGKEIQGPTLNTPQYQSIISPFKPSFEWETTYFCKKFKLEVSEDSLFKVNMINKLIDTTYYQNRVSLKYLTKYYWRVKAYMDIDSSIWSPISIFYTTNNPDFVESLDDLCTITPNPCENYFRIDFNNDLNERIIIKLYNLLGLLVFSEEFENKQKSIEYNVSNFNSGAYFLSFEIGNKMKIFPINITK